MYWAEKAALPEFCMMSYTPVGVSKLPVLGAGVLALNL